VRGQVVLQLLPFWEESFYFDCYDCYFDCSRTKSEKGSSSEIRHRPDSEISPKLQNCFPSRQQFCDELRNAEPPVRRGGANHPRSPMKRGPPKGTTQKCSKCGLPRKGCPCPNKKRQTRTPSPGGMAQSTLAFTGARDAVACANHPTLLTNPRRCGATREQPSGPSGDSIASHFIV